MARPLLPDTAANGGFPEPPASSSVRVIAARHDACGASTRVRLPGTVPARAVRRFHCASCAAAFEDRHAQEIELRLAAPATPAQHTSVALVPDPGPQTTLIPPAPAPRPARLLPDPGAAPAPAPAKPKLLAGAPKGPKRSKPALKLPDWAKREISLPSFDPESRTWRLASVGLAALAVLAVLLIVRGGDEAPQPSAVPAAATASAPEVTDGKGSGDGKGKSDKPSKPAKDTKFVNESSFSLALPAGWQRVEPPAGATFAAVAADGGADATLWIKEDPKLDFPTFVSQSLAQLKTLAGSAQVVERVPAPTAEGTIVTLAADAPEGQPTYQVTLRVAGPYRYYLATTVQPDASTDVVDGVDLITGSFTPELEG